jgi:hypothetical protein
MTLADRRTALLRAHDEDLRSASEVGGADRHERLGPLWLAWFGDQGFVTYRDLGGAQGRVLDDVIASAVERFAADPRIGQFEWKMRGHDLPDDLDVHLAAAGLVADDAETVMIGEAEGLAGDIALGPGVVLRRAGETGDLAADVAAVGRLHREVFGPDSPNLDERLLRKLTESPDSQELWMAEEGGSVVCAGRLARIPGTRFAGLFGGATATSARHRGIYRALTSARAGSALAMGATLVYAECTPFSRPILERSGLIEVTSTTPWVWRRDA